MGPFHLPFLLLLVFLPNPAVASPSPGAPLHWTDDLGTPLEDPLEVCATVELETTCETVSSALPFSWPPGAEAVRSEGKRHGPVRLTRRDLPRTEDGDPALVAVPRKARVVVRGLGAGSTRLTPYPLDDLTFRHPGPSHGLEPDADGVARLWLPAGEFLVSLSSPSLAPDLHLVEAAPGATVRLRHTRRPGWSLVVVATAAEATEGDAPVAGTELTVEGIEQPDDGPVWTGRTGRRGLALVGGITARLARGEARHPRYLPLEVHGLAAPDGTFTVRRIEQRPGIVLSGTVTLQGEPLAGARWRLVPVEGRSTAGDAPEPVASGRTSPDGELSAERLAPGRFRLLVAPPAPERGVHVEELQLVEARETVAVDLAPVRVYGVVTRGEEPPPGFVVTALPAQDRLGSRVEAEADGGVTDEEGRYELTVWQDGEFVVTVTDAGGSVAAVRFERFWGPDEELDIPLPAHPVVGRVEDSDGRPVPEAQVTLSGRDPAGRSRMSRATVDEDGRFSAFWDLDGELEIEARADGYAPSPRVVRTLSPGVAPPPVRLVLARRATLEGRVVGPAGEPVAGVRVWKVAAGVVPRVVGEAVTGVDGRFEIASDAAGERGPLWLSGPGCPLVSHPSPAVDEPVEIQCAETAAVLVVHLTDEDGGPLVGQSLHLRHDSARGRQIVPDSLLQLHLQANRLPAATDGTGSMVLLVAPGAYDLFLAGASSVESITRDLPHGFLGTVVLDGGVTREVEVVERERSP